MDFFHKFVFRKNSSDNICNKINNNIKSSHIRKPEIPSMLMHRILGSCEGAQLLGNSTSFDDATKFEFILVNQQPQPQPPQQQQQQNINKIITKIPPSPPPLITPPPPPPQTKTETDSIPTKSNNSKMGILQNTLRPMLSTLSGYLSGFLPSTKCTTSNNNSTTTTTTTTNTMHTNIDNSGDDTTLEKPEKQIATNNKIIEFLTSENSLIKRFVNSYYNCDELNVDINNLEENQCIDNTAIFDDDDDNNSDAVSDNNISRYNKFNCKNKTNLDYSESVHNEKGSIKHKPNFNRKFKKNKIDSDYIKWSIKDQLYHNYEPIDYIADFYEQDNDDTAIDEITMIDLPIKEQNIEKLSLQQNSIDNNNHTFICINESEYPKICDYRKTTKMSLNLNKIDDKTISEDVTDNCCFLITSSTTIITSTPIPSPVISAPLSTLPPTTSPAATCKLKSILKKCCPQIVTKSCLLAPKQTKSTQRFESQQTNECKFIKNRQRQISECSDDFIVFEFASGENNINCNYNDYDDTDEDDEGMDVCGNDYDDDDDDDDEEDADDYEDDDDHQIDNGYDVNNEKHTTDFEYFSDSDNENNLPDSGFYHKKVRFDDKPKINYMYAWSFAYSAARKGPWEQYGRDNERFRERIRRAHQFLLPIITKEHRQKIYLERFHEN